MTPSPQRCQDEKRRRDEEPPQDAITPMTQETVWSSRMDLHLGAYTFAGMQDPVYVVALTSAHVREANKCTWMYEKLISYRMHLYVRHRASYIHV